MALKWTFEIRDTVPDYPQPYDQDADVQRTYDHVNVMCFLLYDIPYRVVYGPAKVFAQRLLGRMHSDIAAARRLLGSSLFQSITDNLEHIRNKNGSELYLMRLLYQEMPAGGSAGVDILQYFQNIATAAQHNSISLCIPFLDIQSNGTFISEPDMTAHINEVGHFTLFDIFTKSKLDFPALRTAVENGKNIGALGRRGHLMQVQSYTDARIIPPLNNRWCNNYVCEYHANAWCNADSNGNCTTGS